MRHLPWNFCAIPRAFGHLERVSMALVDGFPVVGSDQFMPPARLGASPTFQALSWLSGRPMGVSLFAAATRAWRPIMTSLGLHLKSRSEIYMALFTGGRG